MATEEDEERGGREAKEQQQDQDQEEEDEDEEAPFCNSSSVALPLNGPRVRAPVGRRNVQARARAC